MFLLFTNDPTLILMKKIKKAKQNEIEQILLNRSWQCNDLTKLFIALLKYKHYKLAKLVYDFACCNQNHIKRDFVDVEKQINQIIRRDDVDAFKLIIYLNMFDIRTYNDIIFYDAIKYQATKIIKYLKTIDYIYYIDVFPQYNSIITLA